jgi:diketogulonate reductase-like aldo/keto reductase
VKPANGAVPVVTAAGVDIPRLGFGTWPLKGEVCASVVREALSVGYRHIDTAQGYENEAEVGRALASSGVPRNEVFITTKVTPWNLGAGTLQHSVEQSLSKLTIDRIDLLLIHWPNPLIALEETILALNDVKRQGLVRAIGLSNFTMALLERAWSLTSEPFAAEQIEFHPFLDQRKIAQAIRARGMALIAYSPLALGRVADDPVIRRIAAARARTPAQIALRWLLQQPGVVAIPKTARPERLRENFAVFDFELDDSDMAAMSALTRPGSRLVDEPQWVGRWD